MVDTQSHAQADNLRNVLSGLLQQIAEAEKRLTESQAAQLVEANERLVVAAMHNQLAADTASHALDDMAHSVSLDPLTKLPTRAILVDRFDHAVAMARRHGACMALMFVDLNQFKQINDTLGHAVGDEVLMYAAQCLVSAVREQDSVLRLGGDEFVVLLPEMTRPEDAAVVATKMLQALNVPCQVAGHTMRLSASVGISIYPDDGADLQTLMRLADASMYRAKRAGIGSHAFHGKPVAVDTRAVNPPLPHPRPALAAPARGDVDAGAERLREANEQLVLSALNASDLLASALTKNRRQMETMAMVAHELRDPLAPIRAAALLLEREYRATPSMPSAQGIIERQVLQLSRLIDDLVDVSRINTGKLTLRESDVDLVEVVHDAVEAWRPAMDMRFQTLHLSLPAGPLRLRADPLRLMQVLSNLLNNASKYTAEHGAIALTLTVVGNSAALSVKDDGVGIASGMLAQVFEPFIRDSQPGDLDLAGLGLGLTVARQLVQAHGGDMVAVSAGRGHGSEFVVTLPLARPLHPDAQDRAGSADA
ncbi:MAG: diguanylate cyclase [Chitinophagaceae bacterium]|nr:diguanylate cyclase [Rubrivivax sp.]